MIRLFVPFVNLLAAVLLKIMFQGEVSVVLNAPNEVVAGTEFNVELTIDKGDLASFSLLNQELPAGLSATSNITSNGDFNFKEKNARFIWLRMPDEEQFKVSYKVKVDQRLKGNFSINGKFSYIDNNERRSVSVKSENITILPSPDIDPSLIVDIADYERLVIPYISPATADPQIACIRQKPIPAPDGSGYIVNLLVSKERKEKFAKIEETIPKGFKAEEITGRDALFTFKGDEAKYVWLNLPATSFFTVSYKLVPTNGASLAPNLDGKFSYLEEEKTISIDIQQTSQDLASVTSPEDLNQIIMNIGNELLASNTETGPDRPSAQEQSDQDLRTKIVQVSKLKNGKPKKPYDLKANSRFQLEAEDGIYYRVQLAAGHKPVSVKKYFKRYKLDKEVRKEIHEGWHKYSIGSFHEYKSARDYRVHVWNTTVIDDAFVAAYNNGERITVQEALMIANQKWYK